MTKRVEGSSKASSDLKHNLEGPLSGLSLILTNEALGLPLPVEPPASEPEDGSSGSEDEGEDSETANYSFDDASDEESGAFDDGDSSYATTAISRCTSVSSARAPSLSSEPLRHRQLSIRSLPGREDIEIVRYRSATDFMEAMARYEQWQIAPVLAPAAALHQQPRQDNRRNTWLCAYSKSRDRLELICTKLEGAPVTLAAPLYAHPLGGPQLIGALSKLESEMHGLIPAPTRGDSDCHIFGPVRLAVPFAKLWRRTHGIREASTSPDISSSTGATEGEECAVLRKKVMKLCHLPDTKQMLPNAPLPDLFVIRHADVDDDSDGLAEMLVDSAKEQGRLLSFWEARQIVLQGIPRRLIYIYFCRSQRTPTVSLTAGILVSSDRTQSIMTIVDVYVPPNFRGRGVGEALCRWATIDFFEAPSLPGSPDLSSEPVPDLKSRRCVVAMLPTDKANEGVNRMLSRVGFRLTKAKQRPAPTAPFALTSNLLDIPHATSADMTPISTTTSDASAYSSSSGSAYVKPASMPLKRPDLNRQPSYQRWVEVDPRPSATRESTGQTTPDPTATPRAQPFHDF